ncbi:MAG: DUF1189 family protein [Clostridia bacterium]
MKKARNGFLKFPRTFLKTLYDLDYYRILDKLPLKKGILYLIMVSVISGIIAMIPFLSATNRDIEKLTEIFTYDSPAFSIEEGRFRVEGQSPVTVHEQPGKDFIIVMDQEDATSIPTYREYRTAVVFFSDSLYIKYTNLSRNLDYDSLFVESVDKEDFLVLFSLFRISFVFFALFFVLYMIITRFIGAFIIAFLARTVAIFTKKPRMTLKRTFNLACYASTLPTILATAALVFSVQVMFADIIYVLFGLLYVWPAIKRIHSSDQFAS